MQQHELVLDRHVLLWVFVPLTCAVILMMLLRQFISKVPQQFYLTALIPLKLMSLTVESRKEDLKEIRESQSLAKSRRLREQAKWITHTAFLKRKAFLTFKDTGLLCQKVESKSIQETVATDPSMMVNMIKGQLTGLVPQVPLILAQTNHKGLP